MAGAKILKMKWTGGGWVMAKRERGRRSDRRAAEPPHHADWDNSIGHQWVLYEDDRGFCSLAIVTHNHKNIYHKRSHWMVRVNWLHHGDYLKRISRRDAEFLLALSRDEALEQLEAAYGRRAAT